MNGSSLLRAGRPPASRASGRAVHPELLFRGLIPSEALLMLAREQDALCRAVHPLDAMPAQVAIARAPDDDGRAGRAAYEVRVRARYREAERCGSARHADAAMALRAAYSELLRALVHATPCPCLDAA